MHAIRTNCAATLKSDPWHEKVVSIVMPISDGSPFLSIECDDHSYFISMSNKNKGPSTLNIMLLLEVVRTELLF